ncbi:NAC transcription factor NAM-1 [Linum grandiflorum]
MKIKNLGVGYRFKPSDQDLILTYLFPLAIRVTPFTGIIECDLYSPDEPWKSHFHNEVNESELYFFTKKKKKKKNEKGKRVERSFGNCLWRSQKEEEEIVYTDDDMNKSIIGFKRSFTYKVTNQSGMNSSLAAVGDQWVVLRITLSVVCGRRKVVMLILINLIFKPYILRIQYSKKIEVCILVFKMRLITVNVL